MLLSHENYLAWECKHIMGHMGLAYIGKMIVSAVVHAIIYGAIWRLFRHLSTPEVIGVAIVTLFVLIIMARRQRY